MDPIFWLAFFVLIGFLLFLDLFVFHREAHVVGLREAGIFSAFWIALGVAFGVLVFAWLSSEKALEYYTGYLIEKSLSIDNVFIFALIFGSFAVPAEYQHRVLFWGVLGALVMRFIKIVIGAALIEQFAWLLLIFGAFLVFTGVRMGMSYGKPEKDPEKNAIVQYARRHLPFSAGYDGHRFFTRENGRRLATPLLLVLISVEVADLILASPAGDDLLAQHIAGKQVWGLFPGDAGPGDRTSARTYYFVGTTTALLVASDGTALEFSYSGKIVMDVCKAIS